MKSSISTAILLLFVSGLCIAVHADAPKANSSGDTATASTSTSTSTSTSSGTSSGSSDNSGAANNAPTTGELKIYKRLIPADVLRDFPGMCFASTRCATVEPGKTWDLTPFCGRSTCVQNEDNPTKLLELVEDCGPLPLANDKCTLDTNKTNKTAPFPYCCPIFTCEAGVELEYPELPKDAVKTTTTTASAA